MMKEFILDNKKGNYGKSHRGLGIMNTISYNNKYYIGSDAMLTELAEIQSFKYYQEGEWKETHKIGRVLDITPEDEHLYDRMVKIIRLQEHKKKSKPQKEKEPAYNVIYAAKKHGEETLNSRGANLFVQEIYNGYADPNKIDIYRCSLE